MPPPQVTGVAPREGYPGSKITLRGENLGQSYDDIVSVKICHVDVTLTVEWINSTKLIAYSGLCKGRGDVIVTTRSGGTGIGTVGFTGLIKKNIGSTDETAVWIDEDPKSVLTWLKKSVSNVNLIDNPLGICVEDTDNGISDTLEQLFPQTTGDIRKPNFNATRFLLENYQHAK
jgi:exocyst complex component 2